MKKSNHALKRCQQRGIREPLIQLICEYGRPSRRPGDQAEAITLGSKGVDQVTKDIKKVLQLVPKLKDVTVIVSDDHQIITTYRNNKKNYRRSKCD